jgi:hypothetical protein
MVFSLGYLASLKFLTKAPTPLRIAASFGLGSGLISFIMSGLGVLYNFQLVNVLLAYGVSIAILLWVSRRSLKKILSGLRVPLPFKASKNAFAVSVIVLAFVGAGLFHIYSFPDLYKDAPIYSQWSKIMFDDKRINFIEGGPTMGLGFASNYPSAYQALSAFIFNFSGEGILPIRLTSLLVSLMTLLLVIEWSSQIFKGKLSHAVPALIFTSLPFVIFFSRSSSHYMYFLFQFSLGCYFLWEFLSNGGRNNLYLSSFFGGFTLATSYLGLSFLPVFLLAFKAETKFYKNIMISLLIILLIASPWYLKNLIVLGSPIWPIGGSKYIDPNIQAISLGALGDMSKTSGFSYSTAGDLTGSIIRLLFSYVNPQNASTYQGSNPFFVVLALPAALLVIKNWKIEKGMQFIVLWFFITLVFFVVSSSYWNRYLIAAGIPVTLLSSFALQKVFDTSLIPSGFFRKTVKCLVVLSIVALWSFSIYLVAFWDECNSGNIENALPFLGDYDKILEVCYGDKYALWTWANENLPKDSLVATTDSLDLYYYKMPTIETNSYWLNGLMTSKNVSQSVAVLKANGVKYIAATTGKADLDKDPQFFRKLKEFGDTAVYQII